MANIEELDHENIPSQSESNSNIPVEGTQHDSDEVPVSKSQKANGNMKPPSRSIVLKVPLKEKKYSLKPAIPRSSSQNCTSERKIADVTSYAHIMNFIPIKVISAIIILFAVCYPTLIPFLFHEPEACDMTQAVNRDFNKFYGIINFTNHFTTTTADDCRSTIIFKPAMPQAILKPDRSASSFMTLAPYGTGKTLLRCEYFKSLDSNNYFKILVLNKQISEYMERFVTSSNLSSKDCETSNCLSGWSKNEFAEVLLSIVVTEFVNTYQTETINIDDMSNDEKMQIITVLCFYYNGQGTNELEYFVNSLLKKDNNESYKASEAIVQIQERNVYRDKPLLIRLSNELEKFRVLRQNKEKLHLLLSITEVEGFQYKWNENKIHGNAFTDLRDFALFIKKHTNRSVVFIVDGIDENRYFFNEKTVNKEALETFCRSTISQDLLGMLMANTFHLSLFYPKLDDIRIQENIVRNDKFPTFTINWNSKSLNNYADYVVQEMNKMASLDRCQSLTDFKTLVNYEGKGISNVIDRLTTPRALHFFMGELIRELNDCAKESKTPFRATFENVQDAYKKAEKYFYNNRFNRE